MNMAMRKVTTIAVDKKFFIDVFEKQRKQLQKQLGLNNLSQANFTKMIDIKIKLPKSNLKSISIKKRSKKGELFKI